MSWLTSSFTPTGTLKLACDNGSAGGNLTLSQITQFVVAAVPTTSASAGVTTPATASTLGLIKGDNSTISIASDGTVSVVAIPITSLSSAPALTGSEIIAINTSNYDYKVSVNTLKAFVGSSASVATASTVGIVKADGVTLNVASDGTLSVSGVSVTSLNSAPTLTGSEVIAINSSNADYKVSVSTLKAFVGASSSSTTVATSSVAGAVKPDNQTLQVASDGTLSAVTASIHTISAGTGLSALDEAAYYSISANTDVKYTAANMAQFVCNNFSTWATVSRPILAPGVAAVGFNTTLSLLDVGIGLSNGSANWLSIGSSGSTSTNTPAATTATTFTVSLSGTTGNTGTSFTITVTPGSGGFPATTVTPSISGVTATFSPTSTTVTSGSTSAITFTCNPSTAGTATINAAATGMTSNGSKTYTVTTAAAASTNGTLTLTNATFASRGDGSGKQMFTGGTVSGSVPVTFQYGGQYFCFVMKCKTLSGVSPTRTLPFIKVSGPSQSVGLVATGSLLKAWTSDFVDAGGNLPSDGAIHEFACSVSQKYTSAYVDGTRVSQGGTSVNFDATNLTISIDMSQAPPGLFSIVFYQDQYTNKGSPIYTYELDGSGASSTSTTATAPSYATTFAVTLSSSSITAGSTTTMTVTPGSGGWPSGELVTPSTGDVNGSFSSASATGSGTTPVTFTYTSTVAGSTVLNASASGMTSGGGQTLTTTAAATASTYPALSFSTAGTYGTAKFGSAALNGGKASVTLPAFPANGQSGPADQASFSFGCWVKCQSSSSGTFSPWIVIANNNYTYGFYLSGTGNLGFSRNGNSTNTGVAVRDNNWHYLLMSVTSTGSNHSTNIYVDGTLISSNELNVSPYVNTGTSTLTIDTSVMMAGDLIDELVVYNYALSSTSDIAVPTAAPVRNANTCVIYHLDGNGNAS